MMTTTTKLGEAAVLFDHVARELLRTDETLKALSEAREHYSGCGSDGRQAWTATQTMMVCIAVIADIRVEHGMVYTDLEWSCIAARLHANIEAGLT